MSVDFPERQKYAGWIEEGRNIEHIIEVTRQGELICSAFHFLCIIAFIKWKFTCIKSK